GLQRDSFGTRSGRGFIKQESPNPRHCPHLRAWHPRNFLFCQFPASSRRKTNPFKPTKTASPLRKRTFVRQKMRAVVKQTHSPCPQKDREPCKRPKLLPWLSEPSL